MYHQIARNKRKSVIVVAAFFIIWAAIGYVIGYHRLGRQRRHLGHRHRRRSSRSSWCSGR